MPQNEVIECDGFVISFLPDRPLSECSFLDEDCMKPENIGRAETALVVPDPDALFGRRTLILFGDWRKQYTEASVNGLDACIQVFMENIEHIGDTSDMPKERKMQ
jgi:hypothetical protein